VPIAVGGTGIPACVGRGGFAQVLQQRRPGAIEEAVYQLRMLKENSPQRGEP